MSTKRLTMAIYDLGCGGGGALIVERALARAPGVARVYVNPATEMAYVEYDPALACPDQLIAAVERVGFRAGEALAR
ncbi:MAG: heavy-metal-associated domain-containing protein [Chloroflexi bacterium]|nr:heavy-metal-associated domain-containing protein [Chloroflexota bacterium]